MNINFLNESVWTPAGLSQVQWAEEDGRKVPILFVKTPSKGIVAAGLRPSSLRWSNSSIFATFVSLDGGEEFLVNTRFYGERRELLIFCAQLLRRRRKTAKAKRAQARKASRQKLDQLSWNELRKEASRKGIKASGRGRTREALLRELRAA